jgi:hypothetical protein
MTYKLGFMTYQKEATLTNNQHPLKRLREICGDISQAVLSEVTGLNVDSIRAAEIGRRKGGELSDEQLSQILLSIGAYWDRNARDWFFLFTRDNLEDRVGPVPYKKEHYETFRAELKAEAQERAGATCYLLLRLLYLLESVPNKEFNGWFWQINALLNKWGAKKLGFGLSPNWSASEMRVLGYRKTFWLDGEDQKFTQLLDAYRVERQLQKKRDQEAFDRAEKPAEQKPKRPRQPQNRAL